MGMRKISHLNLSYTHVFMPITDVTSLSTCSALMLLPFSRSCVRYSRVQNVASGFWTSKVNQKSGVSQTDCVEFFKRWQVSTEAWLGLSIPLGLTDVFCRSKVMGESFPWEEEAETCALSLSASLSLFYPGDYFCDVCGGVRLGPSGATSLCSLCVAAGPGAS